MLVACPIFMELALNRLIANNLIHLSTFKTNSSNALPVTHGPCVFQNNCNLPRVIFLKTLLFLMHLEAREREREEKIESRS